MDYRKFRLMALTISPPIRRGKPDFLYNGDVYEIRRWLNKFSKHWLLYPEFDINSRLHYHGIVQVTDMKKLHKTRYRFQKLVGFVKLDLLKDVTNHITWLQYCKKDYGECHLDLFYYKSLRRKRLNIPSPELDQGILMYFKPDSPRHKIDCKS